MRAEITASGTATRIEGPLVFLKRTLDVGLNTAVQVRGPDGRARIGRVAAVSETELVVEVLESTSGLGLADTTLAGELKARAPAIRERFAAFESPALDADPPVLARIHADLHLGQVLVDADGVIVFSEANGRGERRDQTAWKRAVAALPVRAG